MSGKLIAVFLAAVGLLHLIPASGVLGAARLEALYGVPLPGADLLILTAHRAVLLGIVGLLCLAAAWRAELRVAAYGLGLLSMLSFILLAWIYAPANALLQRVALADLIGSGLLLVAAGVDFRSRMRP